VREEDSQPIKADLMGEVQFELRELLVHPRLQLTKSLINALKENKPVTGIKGQSSKVRFFGYTSGVSSYIYRMVVHASGLHSTLKLNLTISVLDEKLEWNPVI